MKLSGTGRPGCSSSVAIEAIHQRPPVNTSVMLSTPRPSGEAELPPVLGS